MNRRGCAMEDRRHPLLRSPAGFGALAMPSSATRGDLAHRVYLSPDLFAPPTPLPAALPRQISSMGRHVGPIAPDWSRRYFRLSGAWRGTAPAIQTIGPRH